MSMSNSPMYYEEALPILLDGQPLVIVGKNRTVVRWFEDSFHLKSSSMSCSLKKEDFEELYHQSSFVYPNEDEDVYIDKDKDKEYYSWKQ